MKSFLQTIVKFVWPVLSIAVLITGIIWRLIDPENSIAFLLYFIGWLLTLLVIGYFSTPSNSSFGKIAFGFVVLMVMGIASKILHFLGGDVMIIAGLTGLGVTYVAMWYKKKKQA